MLWSLLGAASVGYLTTLAALAAAATLPALLGWSTFVVQSGSMTPAVRAGDALVAAPVEPGTIRRGQIALVDDPAVHGRVLSHRVDDIRPDGEIITKGDANAEPDSTPVPADRVLGLARMRVPFVGLPQHWLAERDDRSLLLWTALTAVAVTAAVTDPTRRPAKRHASRGPRTPRRRPPRRLTFGLLAVAGLVATAGWAATGRPMPIGAADASFSSSRSNGANLFSAKPDFVAPDAGAVTVAKTATGYLTGAVRPSSTYHVYANVTDTGNPPSGTATVRSDVSAITSGATAAGLSSGSVTVGGSTYNFSSTALTAGAPTGTKSYTVTLTDTAGNSRTRTGYSVNVDGTAPTATNVDTTNRTGGTVGKPETGDSIVLTYSEQIDPYSIASGWTGAGQSVTVRMAKSGSTNLITVLTAGGATLPLGTVSTPAAYTSGTVDFTGSTMTQSAAVVTLTLGSPSTTPTTVATSNTLSWTPSATAYDAAGNPAATTARAEQGASDIDF
jgi:signal peptidase I